ncbi:hypothetical protein LTR05_003316 [Lithohypha guttulata]|uniref:Uncharacterized protein n=1 Tax=Lithohypha guttulata TaxID=1690604 RepID=A0AAN7T3M0_9EURO|nr:hypothetical protein LTR05_003316 [Lithohypha guttulata]
MQNPKKKQMTCFEACLYRDRWLDAGRELVGDTLLIAVKGIVDWPEEVGPYAFMLLTVENDDVAVAEVGEYILSYAG